MMVANKATLCRIMILLLPVLMGVPHAEADLVVVPKAQRQHNEAETAPPSNNHEGKPETYPPAAGDHAPGPPPAALPQPPDDPCLPRLYHDWEELGANGTEEGGRRYRAVRLLIDRSQFMLTVEGILPDGSTEDVYFTHIGLGDLQSRTPAGRFFINHLYCYPDVVYFDPALGPIPDLYNGFLAPLMVCNREGQCRRFRELGLHGFDASVYPESYDLVEQTYGPVSAGCIRVPEPCELKAILIRLVGVGPLKQNGRGCYHWLKKPVEVIIDGQYPGFDDGAGLSSYVGNGLRSVRKGLKGILGLFGP
ncbi:MAG: L,D-transpeptidase [Pseudomonadota bacterium]